MNRVIAPELTTVKKVDLIFPQRIDLGNDIDLFWINEIPDNTVKLDFIWNAGSKYQTKPLTAQFCNHLLFSGNEHLSSNQIAEKIDSLGGYLSHSQNQDHAGFTIFGLKDSILPIFEIIKSNFESGFFPQQELNKWKDIKKKEFELNEEIVSNNARKLFINQIFGKQHPYGKSANIDDFKKITRKDLQSFFIQKYLKTKPILFLVGNVSDDFIETLKKFTSMFSDSKSSFTKKTPAQKIGNLYQTKQNAVQTAIRIGKIFIDKKHPDFTACQILNTVLGGYFGSRLMKNIREDKGYTYGIGSGISVLEDATYFFISTEVAVEKKEDTLKEIYREIDKLQTELISEKELTVVKNYMLGSLLRNSDGAIAMMEKYKNIYIQGLSESYYSDYINSINEISSKKLQKIAIKYFNVKNLTEVSFG